MYRIDFNQVTNTHEPSELVRMFLSADEYEFVGEEKPEQPGERTVLQVPPGITDKNEAKRWLYDRLSAATGKTLDWGILTGVRPVKLYGEVMQRVLHEQKEENALSPEEEAAKILRTEDYLSEGKINLLAQTYRVQQKAMTAGDARRIGMYIGIPFCPTRCWYCSFTSNQKGPEEIARYLQALEKEIRFTGAETAKAGMEIESVYIGGGTPTTLTAEQLRDLLRWVQEAFDLSKCREFTVEAGRPDTITREKLQAILEGGADRISINPQTMKQETLDRIGRSHTPEQIRQAFSEAKAVRIPVINADLIAGLPGEEPEDFAESLRQVMALDPQNITVHTLAVKRGSRLHEEDKDFSYRQGERVRQMLQQSAEALGRAGYRPYYLYRQKQMTGNFENVGYARPGTESLYNMKIMEDNQTILALGAGGISKVWYPAENRLERVPNVSNYEIYIERLDEMLERKRQGIFKEE